MKKIKIIISLISIFLITGCTANYNITINSDLSISDNSFGNVGNSIYKDPSLSLEERTTNVIRENIETVNKLGYNYAVLNEGQTIQFSNNFKSLDDYKEKNKYVYQQWFKQLDIKEEEKVLIISATDFYPYNEQDPDKIIIDNLNINIKTPFKVLESNADSINKNDYIYTWKINSKTKDKSIFLKIDTSYNMKKEKNKKILFLIGGLVCILGAIVLYFIYHYKNVNKI